MLLHLGMTLMLIRPLNVLDILRERLRSTGHVGHRQLPWNIPGYKHAIAGHDGLVDATGIADALALGVQHRLSDHHPDRG